MKPSKENTGEPPVEELELVENNVEETKPKEVRHTISAEETFTLAKDVFDLRCFIKSVYNNRAQISRRLNFVGTLFSAIFTVFYVAFIVFSGIRSILAFTPAVAVYCIIGLYGVLTIALIAVSLASSKNSTAKSVKRKRKILKFLRLGVRISSLAMGIAALVMAIMGGNADTVSVALNTVTLVISILFIILSCLPLIFGGMVGLVRWLMSPAKLNVKFSFVVQEWYQLLVSNDSQSNAVQNKAVQKVAKELTDDIGRCIDGYLLPSLGNKKIKSLTSQQIYQVIDGVPAEDKPVTEGVIKNVFLYATECGYVAADPSKEMNLEGSIEVQEKKPKKPKKPTLRERIGKKLSKGILNSILNNAGDADDK